MRVSMKKIDKNENFRNVKTPIEPYEGYYVELVEFCGRSLSCLQPCDIIKVIA